MSTRIRISYVHHHELETLLKVLAPYIHKHKVQPGKAPYQHAYLWMKDIPKDKN